MIKLYINDQKTLELLYEQVSNNLINVLLPEEERFVNLVAEKYTKEVFIAVKRMEITTSGFFLDQIFFTNPIKYDLDVLKVEDIKLKEDVRETIDDLILKQINSKLIYLHKTKRGPFIVFKDIEILSDLHTKENSSFLIIKENEQLITTYVERLLRQLIIYFYNILITSSKSVPHSLENLNWVKWRTKKLKLKNLRQKLPELEGVFS